MVIESPSLTSLFAKVSISMVSPFWTLYCLAPVWMIANIFLIGYFSCVNIGGFGECVKWIRRLELSLSVFSALSKVERLRVYRRCKLCFVIMFQWLV